MISERDSLGSRGFPSESLKRKGARVRRSKATEASVRGGETRSVSGFPQKNPKIEEAVSRLISALGENVKRDGLSQTPRRVARAYEKAFSGYAQDPREILTTFENEGYDEMIVVKDIELYSMCEHHLLPFFGKAHIGYIPNGKIIGLSKIPRLVEIFSRRLQNQERLTVQIAHALRDLIKPRGVGVVLEARHLCMMARGVEKQGTTVLTSTMLGLFKKEINTRGEFLKLIR